MYINYQSLFFVIIGIICIYSGVTALNNVGKKHLPKLAIALGILLMVIANVLNNKGLI